MTYFLLTALRDLFVQALENSLHTSPGSEEMRSPEVHLGMLPPKRQETDDFPFVIVRATDGEENDAEGYEVGVAVIVGVHVDELPPAGVQELHTILDRCRRAMMTTPILAEQFPRNGGVQWKVGDDRDRPQPHPYYLGILSVKYHVPRAELSTSTQ